MRASRPSRRCPSGRSEPIFHFEITRPVDGDACRQLSWLRSWRAGILTDLIASILLSGVAIAALIGYRGGGIRFFSNWEDALGGRWLIRWVAEDKSPA